MNIAPLSVKEDIGVGHALQNRFGALPCLPQRVFTPLSLSHILTEADRRSVGKTERPPGGIDHPPVLRLHLEVEPWRIFLTDEFQIPVALRGVGMAFGREIDLLLLHFGQSPPPRLFPLLVDQPDSAVGTGEIDHEGNMVKYPL